MLGVDVLLVLVPLEALLPFYLNGTLEGAELQQVEDWLVARIGKDHMHEVAGPRGGRCVFTDGDNRPARITGMYEQFPYVVSVYADSPQAATRAWRTLVQQRSPAKIHGVRRRKRIAVSCDPVTAASSSGTALAW